MIALFYLSPNTTGGWVTFTAHLMESFAIAGEDVRLYKVGNRTERHTRPFGYGIGYQNVSREDAIKLAEENPSIIVAVQKNAAEVAADLVDAGAKVVLHDPTELKAGLAQCKVERPWVIRRAVQRQVPGSVFIRHPYVRRTVVGKLPKKRGAVSISRIDFDKHTNLILDANRLGAGVDIRGFENRLYTKFKIVPNYPEWEQSVAHYPREVDAAFNLLLGAKFMVDMSLIKGDGGGTQYTFLEAWDAGTVPIINTGWIIPGDDMLPGINCLTASDGPSIAKAVKTRSVDALVEQGHAALKRHSAKPIIRKVKDWLNA